MRLTTSQIEAIKQDAGCRSAVVRPRGFTIVELITVIIILGVIAAVAVPRFFSRDVFDSRGFYDQVIATLRYAQKEAIAQRRFVCVAFTANSVTLTYDPTPPSEAYTVATCPGNNLTGPTGQTPYLVASNNASFAATPTDFNFNALGSPSVSGVISVNSYATAITVEAETGYVH